MSVIQKMGAWIGDPRRRRIAYVLLALVLAVLCVVPRPYVARAKVVPQDSSSIGLGSMTSAVGGQMQGFAALLGGAKTPVDLYLAIGRGTEVTDSVIARMKLVGEGGYPSVEKARLALMKRVDVHSLTGGIVEVEVRTHDPAFAQRLTETYVRAISDRLTALGEDRVKRKQAVVQRRFKEAAGRVVTAEGSLGEFRRRNNLAAPEAQLGSALSLRAGLEAQLQAKLVELSTLEQFQGPENPQLMAVRSEVSQLRAQIAQSARPDTGPAGPNVAGLSEVSGEYLNLYRDYRFAQALYEVYARASEEVAVETLAAETATDVQVIEAPRLDDDRKFNISAVALLALVIALALFTEIYAPATGIRLWKRAEP
ncbi:capsule biosynthesis protein [Sphingomonas sp. BT-65]|uniref:capsule biosynthesis protein n=1 Tax=Sphingomonas sp. BT-65 TaxID=2989821 RepID=UPI0022362242|nr:capsule biosynthesis protein [Sphingomonas sp. BT-65]MCW4461036.1 capsule biosynthesis protein [Sphingomonas sp. BT-65]